MSDTYFCSFCGKSQHDIKKLIAGPTVFICDECTDLCYDIVHNLTVLPGCICPPDAPLHCKSPTCPRKAPEPSSPPEQTGRAA